jgi:hypothetical protein
MPDGGIRPWVKADALTRCHLYWLPVSSFPSRTQERTWLRAFLYGLFDHVRGGGLSPQCFMEMREIHLYCQDAFIQRSLDLQPIYSFSRRLWSPMPGTPPAEEMEAIRNQEKPFVLSEYIDGQTYWIPLPDPRPFLDEFLGFGGVTILFPGPDPNTVAPPLRIPPGIRNSPHFREIFAMSDPASQLTRALLLRHRFLGILKQAFGRGWEDRVEFRGLLFVLPRLSSRDFFGMDQELLEKLFEASPLYFAESPDDRGVLLASRDPLDETIGALVGTMKQQQIPFPLEARE